MNDQEETLDESGDEPVTAQNRTLTRAEKAVLAVVVNPDYWRSSNVERIEAAGISPRRFYEILANPKFRAAESAAFHDLIRDRIGPVVDASVKTASTEGRDGFQDRRMLLEMAGLYAPKKGVDLTTGGLPLKAYQDIHDGDAAPAIPATSGDCDLIDPIDDGDDTPARSTSNGND